MIFDEVKETHPHFYKACQTLENSCFFYKSVLKDLKNANPNFLYCEDIYKKAFLLSGKDGKKFDNSLMALVGFALEFLQL